MLSKPQKLKATITVGLILLKDDSVLLLRRFNTGYADGQYGLIAGCVDENESITTAMIREAYEEAGIILKPEWLTMSCVIQAPQGERDSECIDFFFVAHQWENTPINNEPHKCDDLAFFSLKALPENLIPMVRKALSNRIQGTYFDQTNW
ncbi:NUDIX domain-containing protein [Candidatus Dependentiae bacterium]|nr:NUDIX domain-containing protein [Candidatus Dependentiae bacterium]